MPIGRERRGDGKPANQPETGLMLSRRMLNDRHFAEARPRNRYSPLLVVLSVVSRGTAPSATLACAYTPTDLCSERVFDAIRKWMRVSPVDTALQILQQLDGHPRHASSGLGDGPNSSGSWET